MFVAIENTPLRYAWGAKGALTQYLGTQGALVDPDHNSGDDTPIQAEIWFGAHYGSPSRILNPEQTSGARDLAEWINTDPDTALGRYAQGFREGDPVRLPFLLKVLAAGKPLSLQVHPSLQGARQGFAREEAAGIPRTAPNRNYRDPFHKPELLVALSPQMSAVAGFRDFTEVRGLVETIARVAGDAFGEFADRVMRVDGSESLGCVVEWVLSGAPAALEAARAVDAWLGLEGEGQDAEGQDSDRYALERDNLRQVREEFPDDAGALIVLLMNHILLRAGESIYVKSGTIHAYLSGVGVEIMAASDNVLRGGLTKKHVDVPELLRVLNCSPTPPPRLEAKTIAEGHTLFSGVEPDFKLQRFTAATATVPVAGPGIALCLGDRAQLRGGSGTVIDLSRGQCVYITADEQRLEVIADDLVIGSAALSADVPLPI